MTLYRRLLPDTIIVLNIYIYIGPRHFRVFLGWYMLDIGRDGLWFKWQRSWKHPIIERMMAEALARK